MCGKIGTKQLTVGGGSLDSGNVIFFFSVFYNAPVRFCIKIIFKN